MKTSVSTPENQLEPEAAVNSMSTSSNEQAQLLDHQLSNPGALPVESKGRNRASVVVLGLALSVGTSSLLLPMQVRKAVALTSVPTAESLDLDSNLLLSPISTPSPIASPIPSALQLAISTATPANPVASSSGYNSVVQGGEDLLSLSKQSLTTPTHVSVAPTPEATSTPQIQIAATLTPSATPTLDEFFNIDGSPATPTPAAEVSAAATPTPALPAPVEQQIEAVHPTVAELSPIQSLSLLSPTPTTTPTVVVTPEAIVAPQYVVPQATVPRATVTPNPGVESPTVIDPLGQLVDLAQGSQVTVLPQLNQYAADVSALPATAPTPAVQADATQPEPESLSPIQQLQQAATIESLAQKPGAVEPHAVAVLVAPSVNEQPKVATPSMPQVPVAPIESSHRVSRGETLNVIARQYGVSVAELIAVNNIDNPNQILVDQQLTIPKRQNPTLESTVAQAPAPVTTPAQSPALPLLTLGMGGTSVSDLNASTSANPFLQNLKSEIAALQQKYQQPGNSIAGGVVTPSMATLATPVPATIASDSAQLTTPEPVNPEFVSDRSAKALPVPSAAMAADVRRVEVRPVLQPPISYNVAVAPFDPATYAPTIESSSDSVHSASMELPRLAAANTYLPSEAGEFKGYIWPAKGILTSGYGWRWGRMHRGIDVAGPTGTPILAAATGVVEYAQWNSGGYGYLVDLRHPDGSLTRYAHNNRILVREGQHVQQGQMIAEMGSTGFSTGPHLHFEIHPAGQGAANPMAFMPSNAPS